eukprot:839909_1
MRFNLAVSRLGSVANYKISPVLYNRSGTVAAALWFSAGLLAVCLVGIVIMFVVDRWHSNLISNGSVSPRLRCELQNFSSFVQSIGDRCRRTLVFGRPVGGLSGGNCDNVRGGPVAFEFNIKHERTGSYIFRPSRQ